MCPSKAGHRSESTDAKGEGSGGLDGDRQGAADALAQSTLPRHPPPQPEPPTPRAESPWLSTPPSRDLLVAVMRGVLQSSCPSPCCRAQPCPLGRPSGLSSAKNPLGPPVVCRCSPEAVVGQSVLPVPPLFQGCRALPRSTPCSHPVATCTHFRGRPPRSACLQKLTPPAHSSLLLGKPSPLLPGWPCFPFCLLPRPWELPQGRPRSLQTLGPS